ncbi:MAG TPA: hypothetical protein VFH77_00105 [Streptomyces sp.]|jgi:hypothetical protein|nr:hypothetical protein [Streptomyces sp.]
MRRTHGGHAAPRHRRQRRRGAALAGSQALRRFVPRALVVACLAGGTTAYVAHDSGAVTRSAEDAGARK